MYLIANMNNRVFGGIGGLPWPAHSIGLGNTIQLAPKHIENHCFMGILSDNEVIDFRS